MKFGFTDSEYQFLTLHLIHPLKQLGALVWIFGSRARGNHKKFSDVDILFSLPNTVATSEISKLKETMEESNFPYKVDMVNVADLAESYRSRVLQERVEL